MNGVAARAGEARGPRARPGLHGRLLALGYALAFFGLLLTGAVLLLVLLAPAVLAALGLGQFLKYQLSTGLPSTARTRATCSALLLGLACCRLVLPAALLATRRLAMLTRRLSARWCGVAIAAAYAPTPGPATAGSRRLGYQQRMSWLLSDVSTWRDLLWLAVNIVAGWVLLLVPVTLVGSAWSPSSSLARPSCRAWAGRAAGCRRPRSPATRRRAAGHRRGARGARARGPPRWRCAATAASPGWCSPRRGRPSWRCGSTQLAQTRRETLDTGAAELRRIERDLHDGAQARLVAMGLTLDAAGRLIDTDPAAARALLYEARDASARALAELRDLVRGIHPPVLADRGLADAVRALALDSPLRVQVTGPLDGRLPAPVESAGYFAVSELLANVAKHSGAGAAEVDLRHSSGSLRITVSDDEGRRRGPVARHGPAAASSGGWPRSTACSSCPARRAARR